MRLSKLIILTALLMIPTLPASAEQSVPLARVAAISHLTYAWLTAERAVVLTGPGLVLLIRPGDSLYEVNDRVESAQTAPRYASDDIQVSVSLATHIERLARQAQLGSETSANQPQTSESASSQSIPEVHGVITLAVHPLIGQEALLVTGQAPPMAPVRITLLATLSSDLPNVVVSRHDIQTEPDGRFAAVVPIGPDYVRDSFLRVIATSGPGVTEASAQILIGPPNALLSVPWEQQPSGVW
jgi:hypothetical protein